ncbi:MurR/RpiR family transcriptional regulator [Bacillus sp. N9]
MNKSQTLLKITSYYSSLTKTEKKVADFVKAHLYDVIYYSVTELADRSGVGESTVLRFSRKLGFSGFQDFKLAIAQDQVQPIDFHDDEIKQTDDTKLVMNKVITKQLNVIEGNLQLLKDQSLEKAVNIILQSKKVTFSVLVHQGSPPNKRGSPC